MNENNAERGLFPVSKKYEKVTRSKTKIPPSRSKAVPPKKVMADTKESTSTNSYSFYGQFRQAVDECGIFSRIQCDMSVPEKILVACVVVYASFAGLHALMNIHESDDPGSDYPLMPDYYEGKQLSIKKQWAEYRQQMEAAYSEDIKEKDPEIDWGDDFDVVSDE